MPKVTFQTPIKKFGSKGEKSGWTYIPISFEVAEKLNPNVKKSYRVKGILDDITIEGIAILPIGEGNFILTLSADIRKKLKKPVGQEIKATLEVDKNEYILNQELVDCLSDDIKASKYFYSLPKSHQNYYSKHIDAAKTDVTKAKRIAMVLHAASNNLTYAEMLHHERDQKQS